VAVPLYTGGRIAALAEAARHEQEAVAGDLGTSAADLVLETTAAYWTLVTSRESARVIDEGLAAYERHLDDARNRERLGLSPRNEVLAVEVERDRARLARLRAENGARIAAANLARLLDLPPAVQIEATDALEDAAIAAAAEATPLETLIETALAQRPERASLVARAAAAQARVGVEKAARLPQVSAAAGFDYANPNRRILPPEGRWKDSWDASVNVAWTLFDGGRAGAAAERTSARATALRRQLEDLDRRTRLLVTQRYLELDLARRSVEVATHAAEAARESDRVAGERHREGVATFSDRLDAEVTLLRAGLDLAEARAQVRVASAALDRAVGR